MSLEVFEMHEWDYAMDFALQNATYSPDPSTQNGAVIVPLNGPMLGACNEFPRGVKYSDDRWQRPFKYAIVEHAERNAVFLAAKMGVKTDGATLVSPWAACADCARSIIQAGILRLVRFPECDNAHWTDSIAIGDKMMSEAGIEIIDFQRSEPFGVALRRYGEMVVF